MGECPTGGLHGETNDRARDRRERLRGRADPAGSPPPLRDPAGGRADDDRRGRRVPGVEVVDLIHPDRDRYARFFRGADAVLAPRLPAAGHQDDGCLGRGSRRPRDLRRGARQRPHGPERLPERAGRRGAARRGGQLEPCRRLVRARAGPRGPARPGLAGRSAAVRQLLRLARRRTSSSGSSTRRGASAGSSRWCCCASAPPRRVGGGAIAAKLVEQHVARRRPGSRTSSATSARGCPRATSGSWSGARSRPGTSRNADGVPWVVAYGISGNTRAFWSLESARRVLGYARRTTARWCTRRTCAGSSRDLGRAPEEGGSARDVGGQPTRPMRIRRLWRPLLSTFRMRTGGDCPVDERWVPPQAWRSSPAISITGSSHQTGAGARRTGCGGARARQPRCRPARRAG